MSARTLSELAGEFVRRGCPRVEPDETGMVPRSRIPDTDWWCCVGDAITIHSLDWSATVGVAEDGTITDTTIWTAAPGDAEPTQLAELLGWPGHELLNALAATVYCNLLALRDAV